MGMGKGRHKKPWCLQRGNQGTGGHQCPIRKGKLRWGGTQMIQVPNEGTEAGGASISHRSGETEAQGGTDGTGP